MRVGQVRRFIQADPHYRGMSSSVARHTRPQGSTVEAIAQIAQQLFPSAEKPMASITANVAQVLSFDDVYDKHFDFVIQVLSRQGARSADVPDLAQEVFLVVHQKLSLFEGRSDIRTWLYAIVWRVVRQHQRTHKSSRFESYDELADEQVHGGNAWNTEVSIDRARAHQLVLTLVNKHLPPEQQEVFLLHHLEELTAKQIAEIIQIPLHTVYSRLRAADAAFETAYQRYLQRQKRHEVAL